MLRTNLVQESDNRRIVNQVGQWKLIEYTKDVSVHPELAETAFYMSQMNVHKRQAMAILNNTGAILQAGAMQLMLGGVEAQTNINGAMDLAKKFVGSRVTGESTVKPRYRGNGILLLEPTYRYILFEDVANWGAGMVLDDGLFLACDETINMNIVARTNLSSALAGGEGLFNTCLSGQGTAVLESPVPREELIIIDLDNDVAKIDGNMAIAWSASLNFTVERTTRSLIGSAASGEGLVNVYRGTGRILMAPVR